MSFPEEEVIARIRAENPWWDSDILPFETLSARPYLNLLRPLLESSVRRSIILVGPRRVGKTVMLHHLIREMLNKGNDPRGIAYLSIDHPIYNGLGLEGLLSLVELATPLTATSQRVVIFDEIQYLKDWEVHLKVLQDGHPNIRFIASGSAAAALKRKSAESGAGRFTDFLLPPLTFVEYLALTGEDSLIRMEGSRVTQVDLPRLQTAFIDYINFGGYPEVALSSEIQADPRRFVKSDIIDKVLLRDLPQLYGIQDIQELNHLFTTLAYHTAEEVNPVDLARKSNVEPPTIRKYLQYLEAAFLVKSITRVDRSAKRFKRQSQIKVFLTNPSMRAALFDPVTIGHPKYGHLVETALFSQWFHGSMENYHYARWKNGEVDVVKLDPRGLPALIVEIKSGDREANRPENLKSLLTFCRDKNCQVLVTSHSVWKKTKVSGVELTFVPVSVYAYYIGYMILKGKGLDISMIAEKPSSFL